MLGERAQEQQQFDRAEELLGASIEAIVLAGQSVILVNALEALAKVHLARDHSEAAAVLLGTAHAARESASVHMRPITPPDQALQRTLRQALGPAAFGTAYAEGEAMSPTEALRYVSRLQRGDHRRTVHIRTLAVSESARIGDGRTQTATAGPLNWEDAVLSRQVRPTKKPQVRRPGLTRVPGLLDGLTAA
jgi:hypothetical protein